RLTAVHTRSGGPESHLRRVRDAWDRVDGDPSAARRPVPSRGREPRPQLSALLEPRLERVPGLRHRACPLRPETVVGRGRRLRGGPLRMADRRRGWAAARPRGARGARAVRGNLEVRPAGYADYAVGERVYCLAWIG